MKRLGGLLAAVAALLLLPPIAAAQMPPFDFGDLDIPVNYPTVTVISSGSATIGRPLHLTAFAKHGDGSAMGGARVRFFADPSSANPGFSYEGTANPDGRLDHEYVSQRWGTDKIWACYIGAGDSNCTLLQNIGSATAQWLLPRFDFSIASGTSVRYIGHGPVTVNVTMSENVNGQAGPAMADQPVKVWVTGENAMDAQDLTTDAQGRTSLTYTPHRVGADMVWACYVTPDGSCTNPPPSGTSVTWRAPLVETTGQLPPASQRTGRLTTLTVHPFDTQLTLPDVPVTFSVTGANAQVQPVTVKTGSNGLASFTYRGDNPGDDTVVVCLDVADNPGCETTMNYPLQWTAGPLLSVVAQGGPRTIGRPATFTGTARHSDTGAPWPGEAFRLHVTGPQGTLDTTIQASDANGQSTHAVTRLRPGTYTVTPCEGLFVGGECSGAFGPSVQQQWVAPELSLTPQTGVGEAGAAQPVKATVTDNEGQPMAGMRVLFRTAGLNPGTVAVQTGPDGVATLDATSEEAGTDTVTACTDADSDGECETSRTATLTWQVSGRAAVTAQSRAMVTRSADVTVAVTRAGDGAPLTGRTVHVRADGPAGALSLGDLSSGEEGKLHLQYTRGTPGHDTVTVCPEEFGPGGSCEHPASAGVDWVAPSATLTPVAANELLGSDAGVTATVLDIDGQPLGDAQVLFTVTGANPGRHTATTAADGTATITYTGANAGSDTIVACVDLDADGACEAGATATKVWAALPPPAPASALCVKVDASLGSLSLANLVVKLPTAGTCTGTTALTIPVIANPLKALVTLKLR